VIEEEVYTEQDPAPEPASETVSDPEPASESPSEPEPSPEPVSEPPSVEVVSVDELLDRLAQQDQEGQEEQEAEEPAQAQEDLNGSLIQEDPLQVLGMQEVLLHLQVIQEQTQPHPAMTTPFEEYTVTEGLLLLLLLCAVIAACVKMLKGGFAWLR